MIPKLTKINLEKNDEPDIEVDKYSFQFIEDWRADEYQRLSDHPFYSSLETGYLSDRLHNIEEKYNMKKELFQFTHKNINKIFKLYFGEKVNEKIFEQIKLAFNGILYHILIEEKLSEPIPEVDVFCDGADGNLRIVFRKYSPEWEEVLKQMDLIS